MRRGDVVRAVCNGCTCSFAGEAFGAQAGELFVDYAATAAIEIDAWISWARRSQLAPFKDLSAALHKHFDGIVEHFRRGLSNGFVEAMNGLIQATKARACGYVTDDRLITICYLLCSKLKRLPENSLSYSAVYTAK